jgi:hypothetical protein
MNLFGNKVSDMPIHFRDYQSTLNRAMYGQMPGGGEPVIK